MNDQNKDKLQEVSIATGKGLLAAGGTALALTHPEIGLGALFTPLVAELVFTALPYRRLDRIEQMMKHVYSKVENFDELFQERRKEPEFVDFVESLIDESVKSSSKQKLQSIACMLSSATNKNSNLSHSRRILSILSKLDDFDIALLFELRNKFDAGIDKRENGQATKNEDFFCSYSECCSVADWLYGEGEGYNSNLFLNACIVDNSLKRLINEDLAEIHNEDVEVETELYAISEFGKIVLNYFN